MSGRLRSFGFCRRCLRLFRRQLNFNLFKLTVKRYGNLPPETFFNYVSERVFKSAVGYSVITAVFKGNVNVIAVKLEFRAVKISVKRGVFYLKLRRNVRAGGGY